MSTENWGYTAIGSDGQTLYSADSYTGLMQKLNNKPYSIYHHTDKESFPEIETRIVVDKPQKCNDEVLGAVAKNLDKSLMELKNILNS